MVAEGTSGASAGSAPRGRKVLAALTALNVLNYFDRYVAAAVLPLVITGLHLTDTQAGTLQSAFIWVYAITCPFAGYLGDRRPRLRLAAAGVMLWSAATFASGLAPTFALLFLARALVGVGEGSYATITPSVLSDVYPAHRRSAVLAIFYAAIPVGSALGYTIGGVVGERWGYQRAFFVAGAPGLLLAFVLLALREPVRGALDPQADRGPAPALRETFRRLRARPSFAFNTAGQIVYTFALGGLAFWMPTYFVRERGLPLGRASFLFGAVLAGAGFVGTLIGGRPTDVLARRLPAARFWLPGVALLASGPLTWIGLRATSPSVYWPALFGALTLVFTTNGPLNAAMANVLPAPVRAAGFGVNTMLIHVLGDALSPPLIGAASERLGSLAPPVLACGMLLAASGFVLLAGARALARDEAAIAGASAHPALDDPAPTGQPARRP